MNMLKNIFILSLQILCFGNFVSTAQNFNSYEFVFPDEFGWSVIEEGDTLAFQLSLTPEPPGEYVYSIYGDRGLSLHFDSLGNFFWVPGYDLVDRVREKEEFSVIFEA